MKLCEKVFRFLLHHLFDSKFWIIGSRLCWAVIYVLCVRFCSTLCIFSLWCGWNSCSEGSLKFLEYSISSVFWSQMELDRFVVIFRAFCDWFFLSSKLFIRKYFYPQNNSNPLSGLQNSSILAKPGRTVEISWNPMKITEIDGWELKSSDRVTPDILHHPETV